jgi:DNA (cytosine-5)-methyltransferase 1
VVREMRCRKRGAEQAGKGTIFMTHCWPVPVEGYEGKPTVLSLFSGVGGFDLGLERAGFRVVGQCDNDPFCNKVLAKHWPGVPRYDDVRSIRKPTCRAQADGDCASVDDGRRQAGAGIPDRVDLICGGFPCQDLSVAGKRAGLSGERSGLWFEFHRVLSELRPTFCLIENVPGLLSSNEGRDFAIVLNGLGELWPAVGWAVLDSQHFGVPQRRRRVYIVGGPSRASVQQVLSVCEGGDWHPQAGRAPGQDIARPLGTSATSFSGQRYDLDNETYLPSLAYSLNAREGKGVAQREGVTTLVAHTPSADGFDASEDGTGRGTPLISVRTAQTSSNGWGINEDGTAYTLDGAEGQAVLQRTVRRLTPVECERLQGFPDDWTKLDDGTPDGPRYKALGNAVTVPVIEYLGLRLMAVLKS